jgi:hypothetical protein
MREAERPLMDADPGVDPRPGDPTTGPDDRWGPWKKAILIVVVTHLAFAVLSLAGSYWLSGSQGRPQEGFTTLWHRWDTVHFVDIAEHGYTSAETDQYAEAFFPLYPLTIKAVAFTGLDPVLAGMFISTIASVVALAFLFRLAELELGAGSGWRACMYLALFPTAVFLTAAYSESLFLAGAIPAFYFARRGRWRNVGIPAAVAMGTRFAGAFLLVGLAVEFVRQRDFNTRRVAQAVLSGALALLPLIAYMAYLAANNDGPFEFVSAQAENPSWRREYTDPREAWRTTWHTFSGDYPSSFIIAWRVELLAALTGLAFTAWAFAKKWFGYGVYMLLTLVPLLVSRWYLSIPRILLSLFPIALLIAGAVRNERQHDLVLATSAVFAAMGVLVFTRGQWFY